MPEREWEKIESEKKQLVTLKKNRPRRAPDTLTSSDDDIYAQPTTKMLDLVRNRVTQWPV